MEELQHEVQALRAEVATLRTEVYKLRYSIAHEINEDSESGISKTTFSQAEQAPSEGAWPVSTKTWRLRHPRFTYLHIVMKPLFREILLVPRKEPSPLDLQALRAAAEHTRAVKFDQVYVERDAAWTRSSEIADSWASTSARQVGMHTKSSNVLRPYQLHVQSGAHRNFFVEALKLLTRVHSITTTCEASNYHCVAFPPADQTFALAMECLQRADTRITDLVECCGTLFKQPQESSMPQLRGLRLDDGHLHVQHFATWILRLPQLQDLKIEESISRACCDVGCRSLRPLFDSIRNHPSKMQVTFDPLYVWLKAASENPPPFRPSYHTAIPRHEAVLTPTGDIEMDRGCQAVVDYISKTDSGKPIHADFALLVHRLVTESVINMLNHHHSAQWKHAYFYYSHGRCIGGSTWAIRCGADLCRLNSIPENSAGESFASPQAQNSIPQDTSRPATADRETSACCLVQP
ncbi:hypothetical protein DOTSEDRAFT_78370 [Dothistroma septosporum NZE10]|uniref:Uncharacterized protein n=1 Tax=Dothistroma septosporum (strain NZE10 / CBS 128990) TaxID=675120 RepID=N1PU87_DOTSN|nr:hypothetical protein DOTSEDRAFT_78370 [Dothistroma septosporum NZE10]